MSDRSVGKSLFEDAMDAREDVRRRCAPTSVETRPLMPLSALMSGSAACFVADPILHTALVVTALICAGMTLSLRWDRGKVGLFSDGEAGLKAGRQ